VYKYSLRAGKTSLLDVTETDVIKYIYWQVELQKAL